MIINNRKMRSAWSTPTAWLLLLLVSLGGCGGGGGGSSTPSSNSTPVEEVASCDVASQKRFIDDVIDDWYLWYGELADVNAADYDDPNSYLQALTAPLAVDGRDPGFSYLTTAAADQASLSSGAYIGFGFRYGFDANNAFRFSDVLEGSPAGDADLRRGDKVLAIAIGDEFETIAELGARDATTLEVFGDNEVGVERRFKVEREDDVFEVALLKRELSTPPFAGQPLLLSRAGMDPIGYLHFRSFITDAEPLLVEMARTFRDANVTDLIIDLRYNGGGLLSVAEQLLNIFAGELGEGDDSYRISHNDKRTSENVSVKFEVPDVALSPRRMAFIVTEGTASASELVINAVSPYVDTVLVGSDTFGKAVGQYAFDQTGCENRLRLVAFETLNGEGQGGYYTGLVDTGRFTLCPAADDITREFHDPEEASLRTAVNWLNSGSCAVTSSAQKGASARQLSSDWSLRHQSQLIQGRSPWLQ